MGYSQHQSNFNTFFSIRKSFPQESESNLGVHFFSKQSIDGLQTTTRFYKNKNKEWLKLTGTFVDSLDDVTITGISLAQPKRLDDGTIIPEQITVDIASPVAGKVDRIQISSDSKWGNAFARKIVNVDLLRPLTIKPYAYIPEGKTDLSEGLSIVQNGEKIADKYVKFNGNEKPTNINGVEEFDKYSEEAKAETNDSLRRNAWKNYFTRVNVFVVGEMMKFVKEANFADTTAAGTGNGVAAKEIVPDGEFPEEEINPEDIPF